MDIVLTILCATFVLGFLVFIHEGGHYLSARAFGVRVTEFMLGLPGPSIGKQVGETRIGVTALPLGGYANVCGMVDPDVSDELAQEVLAFVYEQGSATASEVAASLGLSVDLAEAALEDLTLWGSIREQKKTDPTRYAAPASAWTRKEKKQAKKQQRELPQWKLGEPRREYNSAALLKEEKSKQYFELPFWKRAVVLAAGPAMNLLFALVAFVIIYSIIGVDIQNTQTGEVRHFTITPDKAIMAGFNVIGMTLQAIIGLFNPQTAGETISNSASIIGIAVLSKDALTAGLVDGLFFMAIISVSLGLMNLLPIPPLDGGKLIVEIIQRITRRTVPIRVVNALSMVGMLLFIGLFIVMANQDIQRFIFGNW